MLDRADVLSIAGKDMLTEFELHWILSFPIRSHFRCRLAFYCMKIAVGQNSWACPHRVRLTLCISVRGTSYRLDSLSLREGNVPLSQREAAGLKVISNSATSAGIS